MKDSLLFLQKNAYLIAFISIFLVATFLRFYNVPGRYTFDNDATADAVVAYRSADEFQLPLTGNFSSAGAFTFGPWYYYHLIFFYFLTRLPYSVWLLNGILSLGTVVIMYLIGKELKDRVLGLILALLVAVSPAQIAIASSSSNPNIVVFYAALTCWFFILLLKKQVSLWYAFFLGMFVGIAINAHYQALPLLLFPFALLFFTHNHRVKSMLLSLVGVGVTFLPLLFFNLTNHWHTLQNFVYYSLYGKNLIYVPNSWTIYIRDFWPQTVMEFFGIPHIVAVGLMFFLMGSLLYIALQKKLSKVLIIFLGFLLITFIYMRYFWGERHFVYFYYLHPLFYLFSGFILAYFLNLRRGIYIGIFLLIILVLYGIQKDIHLLSSKDYLIFEGQAKEIMSRYPNNQITLYLCEGRDFSRGSALSYLLHREKMSQKNAKIKLALEDGGCLFPKNLAVREKLATREAELLQKFYPQYDSLRVLDFSTASEAAIIHAGWKSIDTDDIYSSEIRWYFTEQP